MDADSGASGTCAVRADLTLTIGTIKPGLVADEAINFVGGLDIVPFPLFKDEDSSPEPRLATASKLCHHIPRRPYDLHKGNAARLGIIAGAPGFLGAARLCSEAALHAGAGLVTLFVPEESYSHIVGAVSPEIMVRGVSSLEDIDHSPFDAFAVGPGLGNNPAGFFEFLKNYHGPIVLDADGLNLVAQDPERWLRKNMVVTPHPGEMKRLFPHDENLKRKKIAESFMKKFPGTLLFKGARTIVAEREKPLSYNGTGNPGMASGGQGDVLTGIIASLMVQGLSGYQAASLGAWLAGKSADLCLQHGTASEESLIASDISRHLGDAFAALRWESN
jgi:NAD(P)H-hydrate epimerase